MTRTFALLYYLRKENINEKGEVPICLRITVDGKRAVMSTQQKIKPDRWNSKTNRVNGTKEEARSINTFLDNLIIKTQKCYRELEEKESLITADIVRNAALGKNNNRHTLIEAFEKHNKNMAERVGKDFAKATRDRYNTTLNHIKDFIKINYNKKDIYLMEMPYEFITDLEHYLKTKTDYCNHNSTQKYIRNFRKVINACVLSGWLPKDPFARYKSRLDPSKKIFLTEKELEALENKRIEIPRLELIRDIFVFCCYTGLAYIDVAKLNEENVKEVEGRKDVKKSLVGNRTKSGTEFYIPLLPSALQLIDKYKNHPKRILKKTLLPILSNQKINAYLKEIADICVINKNLTSYVARKTFATTICVKNHITPTSLMHMLGQKDFRTTIKHYIAFEKDNVDEEMQQLADKKISSKPDKFNLN